MKSLQRLSLIIITSASVALSQSAIAGIVTILKTPGVIQQTNAIDSFLLNANELAGMTVRATFDDGSTETIIWADTGGVMGGANGTGWSITGTGNALNDVTITNNRTQRLTEFLMDAGTGDGVFDTGVASITGTRTANTNNGNTISVITSSEDFDLDAEYFDAVRVVPDGPNGDIFRWLNVEISGELLDGIGQFGFLQFNTDLDALTISGDITPVSVPEPSTLGLLGAGLLGLFMRRKPVA